MSQHSTDTREIHISSTKSAWSVTTIGAISFFALYAFIYHLQSHDKSAAALGMSSMHMNKMSTFWSFPILQASGLVGLVAAYLAVLLGLQQSRKVAGWFTLDYRSIDSLHRHIALLTLGLVIIHAVSTVFDAMGDSWRTVFWFNGWANAKTGWPAAVWGYDLGIIAFYTFLLLGPTFYLRRKIGVQNWKYLHRFILIFYIGSVWHSLILGLDMSYYKWVRPLLWLLQIPLLWLFAKRFGELGKKNSDNKSGAKYLTSMLLVGIAYTGIVAALVIVFTGHSGFIANI
jgi:methionine sulfoxide reductase heme-binding subunit